MKGCITAGLALGVSIISLTAFAGGASAANCHSWTCVNRQLNSLHSQLSQDQRYINRLQTCIADLPLSEFGASNGSYGYLYNDGSSTAYATALDVPAGTTLVDHWVLADSCDSQAFASVRRALVGSMAFGAIAPEAPVSIFEQARH